MRRRMGKSKHAESPEIVIIESMYRLISFFFWTDFTVLGETENEIELKTSFLPYPVLFASVSHM